MEQQQKRIKEFMEFFGQKCPDFPVQLDFETAKLRANLILEETLELICKGLGLQVELNIWDNGSIEINESNLKELNLIYTKQKEVDLEQVGDGVGDCIVVTLGTSTACGIDQEPINIEIFDSNDSKSWSENDLDWARTENPGCVIEKYYENLYRVKRADGKILKSPTYAPPKIKEIIQKQINDGNRTDLQKTLDSLGVSVKLDPTKPLMGMGVIE